MICSITYIFICLILYCECMYLWKNFFSNRATWNFFQNVTGNMNIFFLHLRPHLLSLRNILWLFCNTSDFESYMSSRVSTKGAVIGEILLLYYFMFKNKHESIQRSKSLNHLRQPGGWWIFHISDRFMVFKTKNISP